VDFCYEVDDKQFLRFVAEEKMPSGLVFGEVLPRALMSVPVPSVAAVSFTSQDIRLALSSSQIHKEAETIREQRGHGSSVRVPARVVPVATSVVRGFQEGKRRAPASASSADEKRVAAGAERTATDASSTEVARLREENGRLKRKYRGAKETIVRMQTHLRTLIEVQKLTPLALADCQLGSYSTCYLIAQRYRY
jgi:hypothetical protein